VTMADFLTLAQLTVGARARVKDVSGEPALQQRILEMGLLPGVELKLVRLAPLGDPLEVRLLGYHLSLRRSEAACVLVEPLP
jgi:ferrous iron transport protein A